MKKRIIPLVIGLSAALTLSGCGVGSISDLVGDKLGNKDSAETAEKDNDEDKEGTDEKSEDSAEAIALLGDLMGDKLGKPSDIGSETNDDTDLGDTSSDDDYYGPDAPENQTVVTKADEWQGYYEGTVSVIGFGDYYAGVEEEFDAYAVVIFPEDDNPFLEIYSEGFDIWDNYSFGYEDQALASMYVEPTDTALTPVVYEEGDAYVVDSILTNEEAQAFKSTSDGKSVARIVGKYSYVDPEAASEGVEDTGLLMLFNMTKTPIE